VTQWLSSPVRTMLAMETSQASMNSGPAVKFRLLAALQRWISLAAFV
jgi:hypothetical protein